MHSRPRLSENHLFAVEKQRHIFRNKMNFPETVPTSFSSVGILGRIDVIGQERVEVPQENFDFISQLMSPKF